MDNEKIWCMTLLTAYRALEQMARVLDKTLEKMAYSGFNSYSSYGYNTDTLYSKMLEVIDRKKGLINAKVMVENSLALLPNKEYSVLQLRYVDGVGAEESAKMLNFPKRTYFRYFNKALSSFMFQLKKMGYTVERLKDEYKNEPFFVAIYQKIWKRIEKVKAY